MSEADLVARTPEPVTKTRLRHDLHRLGLRPGAIVIVQSSLSTIGWVVGGARSVIEALMETVGPDGTVMMPAFSEQISDPAGWSDPPVPESWIETIRTEMPAYDPARTETRAMGAIAEQFRTWPGVGRSPHPTQSWAAWGRHAGELTEQHGPGWPTGWDSPLGRFYGLDGQVLLLGVGYNRNSSLHHAETRAGRRRVVQRTIPTANGAGVAWSVIEDVANDEDGLFPRLGADFDATGAVRIGPIGAAESRLMSHRTLVDFAIPWFERALEPKP